MIDFGRLRSLMKQEDKLHLAVILQETRCTHRTAAPPSKLPKAAAGSAQRMEDDVIRLGIVKKAWEPYRDQLKKERAELRPYIERLENPNQRSAMEMRYMHYMGIGDIQRAMNYSRTRVFCFLKEAEDRITAWQKDGTPWDAKP